MIECASEQISTSKRPAERKHQSANEAIKLIPKLIEAFSWNQDQRLQQVIESLVLVLDSHHPTLAKKIQSAMPRKLQPTKVKPHGMIELEDPRHGIDAVVLPDCIQTECRAIVQEHSRSDELKAFGLAPRHKILLHGEPGNGKTLLAEALAFELAIPFLRVKYSSLISGNLGGTARNIDDVLEYARTGPCLIFMDEFDGIGMDRNDGHDVGEMRRITNQLLISIERLPPYCVVVAATNAPKQLDPALMRRFDILIEIPKPTQVLIRRCAEIELDPSLTPGSNVQHLAQTLSQLDIPNLSEVVNLCRRIRRDLVLNDGNGIQNLITNYPAIS